MAFGALGAVINMGCNSCGGKIKRTPVKPTRNVSAQSKPTMPSPRSTNKMVIKPSGFQNNTHKKPTLITKHSIKKNVIGAPRTTLKVIDSRKTRLKTCTICGGVLSSEYSNKTKRSYWKCAKCKNIFSH